MERSAVGSGSNASPLSAKASPLNCTQELMFMEGGEEGEDREGAEQSREKQENHIVRDGNMTPPCETSM